MGPGVQPNILICPLTSVSIYKAQNKVQKYHHLCVCSSPWHVRLCIRRYSHRLPIRKVPCVLLPTAPRPAAGFLPRLSLLDVKIFQIFRQKYFYWNCWELWTPGPKCPDMIWALFIFLHVGKCHGCIFLLYWPCQPHREMMLSPLDGHCHFMPL